MVKKILKTFSDLETRLSATETTVTLVNNKLSKMEEKIHHQEQAVKKFETNVDQLLDEKVDDKNKEMEERERRKKNLVVFGIPENNNADPVERKKHDTEKFSSVCNELGVPEVSSEILNSFRLGATNPKNEPRPLKIILKSEEQKRKILSKARNLKTSPNIHFQKIDVKPDLTLKERAIRKELVIQLKARQSKGETGLVIRNGKIVQIQQPSSQTLPAQRVQAEPGQL